VRLRGAPDARRFATFGVNTGIEVDDALDISEQTEI
jgi:hypothetical protein